jgi:hypothetical protein
VKLKEAVSIYLVGSLGVACGVATWASGGSRVWALLLSVLGGGSIAVRLLRKRAEGRVIAAADSLSRPSGQQPPTVNLGPEYDRSRLAAVRRALREMGAKRKRHWWGVGGSQEITHEEWKTKRGTLILGAETYIGLTVSGPDDLVVELVGLVRRGLPQS